jgi:hypothetical protein
VYFFYLSRRGLRGLAGKSLLKKEAPLEPKKRTIFLYKQAAALELQVVYCPAPAESPVYSADKTNLQAPAAPPFGLLTLNAISLRRLETSQVL